MSKLNGLRMKRQSHFEKQVEEDTKRSFKVKPKEWLNLEYNSLDEENQSDVPEEVYKTLRRLELERA